MKKLLVVLLCMLALFAVASCKNDPTPTPTPEPTPTPDPPAPSWETGTLVVKPAEECTYSQTGKFQFKLALKFNEDEPIEMLMKVCDDITTITIRDGSANTEFITKVPVDEFEKTDDGWLIIKIPAEKVIPAVSPCLSLGITTYLPDDTRANCFVAIKDMKINDEAVDFLEYADEDSFVSTYYTSPDALDVTIVE